MEPLQLLAGEGGAGLPLPGELAAAYGGGLALSEGCLYANFVSSLDGVVALGAPGVSSGGAISGRNEGDRFVMALLRAAAGCVLVGAQTARDDRGHLWTPGYIHPPSAAANAALRASLGLAAEPRLALLTATGDLDPGEPALEAGALVLTTEAGADRLRGRLPAATEVVALGAGAHVPAAAAVAELRRRFPGARILTEGGPRGIGWLLAGGLLDDLFLTLSPVLAGRDATPRPGLVAGLELLPGRAGWARLASVRRQGDHLFLHYRLRGA